MKKLWFILLAWGASLAMAPASWADAVTFTVSGAGISASGTFTVEEIGSSDIYRITGISGTYSGEYVSGTITGLLAGSYDSANPTIQYDSVGGPLASYDNLFYPWGDAPAISGAFGTSAGGGVLDLHGVEFYISGGYSAGLWGNGGDSGYGTADVRLSDLTIQDYKPSVSLEVSPLSSVPEPCSLLLLSASLLGLIGIGRLGFGSAPETPGCRAVEPSRSIPVE